MDKKNTRNKKIAIISGIVSLILILIIFYLVHFHTPKDFDHLKQNPDSQTAITQQIKNNKNKHLTYELYWQPGCKDCHLVEQNREVMKLLAKQQRNHSLTVLNANNKKNLDYAYTNRVHSTPTLIVKQNGYSVYSYSGTNTKIFIKLLNGIDPDTGKAIKTTDSKPTHFTIQNDFHGTKTSIDPVRNNYLTK